MSSSIRDPGEIIAVREVPEDITVDFDMYDAREGLAPIQDWWLDLRASNEASVVWTTRNGGHWLALGGEIIKEVLSNSDLFSSDARPVEQTGAQESCPAKRTDPGRMRVPPIGLDPPEHGKYRKIFNVLLAPRVIRDQEDRIRTLVVELIETFRGRGRCEFMLEFARRVPATVILDMANLPVSDAPYITDLVDRIVRPADADESRASFEKFADYLRPIVNSRRGGSGVDSITALANSKVDGCPLNEEDGLGMVFQFIGAGLDTTTSLLGFAMLYLARNVEERQRLVDQPGLIPAAAGEFIRRLPFVTVMRRVRDDTDIFGVSLRKNDLIVAPTALVNFDETLFANPLDIDFDRKTTQHSTFGYGQHRCPGAGLARTEFRIVLEEWLRRIPQFELDADQLEFRNGIVGAVEALPLRWAT